MRLTVQWRETHDPTAYGGQDAIFPLTLRVFRQLDPEGKVRAWPKELAMDERTKDLVTRRWREYGLG